MSDAATIETKLDQLLALSQRLPPSPLEVIERDLRSDVAIIAQRVAGWRARLEDTLRRMET